ncbi:hypothetical protein [Actinopolymorpha alba]|uniref:zinc finger domain-containing protein n=1 Tax=Actinopolymorpha alba TaxID=533267 RepID=UPI00036334A8|nr:hypothetical protein [Actinopolymorpha alba]
MDAIDSGVVDWVFAGGLADQGYTQQDLKTTAQVLSRPCPHCNALAGNWCVNTGSGTELGHIDKQHVARRIR